MAKRNNGNDSNAIQTIANRIIANRVLQGVRNFGNLGKMFGDKRDVYKAAGYKQDITIDNYWGKYTRQDIAARVINAPADETWREPPIICDGTSEEDQETDTEFVNALNDLLAPSITDLDARATIWDVCLRADKLAAVGRYGIMVLGVNDGGNLETEMIEGGVKDGVAGFLYLTPISEQHIAIKEVNNNPNSNRYRMPQLYSVDMSGDLTDVDAGEVKKDVNRTRAIHIAQGLQNNEIFGTPALESIYNRLDDLEKILAGAGEAAWQLMQKGYILSSRDAADGGIGVLSDAADSDAALESFIHGLTRVLEVDNMDATVLGGEIVDPTGVVKTYISLISGMTGIPQRILLGSEAGQLASSQDERNWAKVISSRRKNFAEPYIIRPLISRLIYCGVLPEPATGSYFVKWPDSATLTETEQAQIESQQASAMAASVGPEKMTIETYLREYRGWTSEQITKMYKDREREIAFQTGDRLPEVEQ